MMDDYGMDTRIIRRLEVMAAVSQNISTSALGEACGAVDAPEHLQPLGLPTFDLWLRE